MCTVLRACGSVSTVCLYINKQADAGPYLERRKVQQLPEHFGPERPSAVLQQAVQACIDCAHQQKLVFSLVKQGYGGEMVSGKALGQVYEEGMGVSKEKSSHALSRGTVAVARVWSLSVGLQSPS